MSETTSKKSEDKKILNRLPAGCKVVMNDELLDEVTGLVELPTFFVGSFDKRFLNLPREVIISALNNHQKCFAVEDENGNLAPYFIFVSNIHPDLLGVVDEVNLFLSGEHEKDL